MPEPNPLHIVSYNIQEGGEDRLDAIHDVIARQRPDVVALQEATNQEHLLELGHRLGLDVVIGESSNGVHVAWLSRFPIRQSHNHQTPRLAKTLLKVQIEWNEQPLSLFTTHLASRHDAQSPADEARALVKMLAAHAGQPFVLAGDFNALGADDPVGTPPPGTILRGEAIAGTPRTTIPTLLAAGFTDCFRAAQPTAPGFTYPASSPWLRLDYVFASPNLAASLMTCNVVSTAHTATASDHLPIEALFSGSTELIAPSSRPN